MDIIPKLSNILGIHSMHFTLNQYLVGIVSAVVTGFAKSGISGMGILVIILIGITPLVRKIDPSAGHWKYWLAPLFGVLAGITSMMANAAGTLVTLYLLWMNVDKNEFLGTNAWFFFIVNCCKVPFSMHLGLITAQSGLLNLFLVPAVLAGAFVGVWLVKRINQQVFEISVQVLTLVAGIRLLF
jgi:uncharacterized membrane protein YfcA